MVPGEDCNNVTNAFDVTHYKTKAWQTFMTMRNNEIPPSLAAWTTARSSCAQVVLLQCEPLTTAWNCHYQFIATRCFHRLVSSHFDSTFFLAFFF